MKVLSHNRHVSTWMLTACGVWLVGLGFYFMVLRPPLLPEDQRFLGTTINQIRAAVPRLENWLEKVFTVMGGFVAATGVLTGALTVVLMSATNFALYSDFRWLLLVPVFVWLVGLVFYLAGRQQTVEVYGDR